jgi:hypothetical protein
MRRSRHPSTEANMSHHRPSPIALAAILIASLFAWPLYAKDTGRALDLIWTHPDYVSHTPRSIAFMPAVSWNGDLPSEHMAEDGAASAIKGRAYRWVSPATVQALLGARPAADSTWKAQRAAIMKQGRVDSLAAPALCAALHVRALFTLRVDELERHDLDWNETGKPITQVQAHAALVDSTGTLLWTASGSEVGEGALQEAPSSMTRVDASGLSNQPATGTGKSPDPREVFSRMFLRWAERFPAPAAAAPEPAKP